MLKKFFMGAAFLLLLSLPLQAQPVASPWATQVHSYHAMDPSPGFDDPLKALGKPSGGGVYAPNHAHAYSIGRPGPGEGSYIVFGFDAPILDDPDNPQGLDFIVFGNAFWVGGTALRRWAEPALIQVSEDVNGNGLPDDPWYTIPGSRAVDASVLPLGAPDFTPPLAGNVVNPNSNGIEEDWGYGDMSPTLQEYLDNYMRPDDPFEVGISERSGGGDAVDIAWAVDDSGQPANLSQIHFVRLSAFINASHGPLSFITPEVVGVAAVARDVDTDGDGILDDYEVRVAGTDPLRPESTVLPLETPLEYGGSPAGTLLDQATDEEGNSIALYSSGLRTGQRNFNCMVDILPVADMPEGTLPEDLMASSYGRFFSSSEGDFTQAQIQKAEFTLAYKAEDIAGLDESKLEPLRYENGHFTSEGIEVVLPNPEENRISFRCNQPGTFILASTAGAGDMQPGHASIPLTADPAEGVTADSMSLIVIESSPFLLADSNAPDPHAVYTLSLFPDTLVTVESSDMDPEQSGTQLHAEAGVVRAVLRAGTESGQVTAFLSLDDGTASGSLTLPFHPGPPAGLVTLEPLNPQATAPGPIHFTSSRITDQFGNAVYAGSLLTLEVSGGRCITPDASPSLPGHQLAVMGERLSFSILADNWAGEGGQAEVHLRLYADATQSDQIGESYHLFDIVAMPVNRLLLPAFLFLLLSGVALLHPSIRKRDSSRSRP